MKAFTLLLLVLLPRVLHAQTVDPAKRQQVEELIRLTGVNAIMGQMVDQCVALAKSHNPTVPDSFWQQERRTLVSDAGTINEAQIAVFAKNLSVEDLQALVAFYKTPAGQHYIRVLPAMTQESMQAMQAWAKQASAQTVQRLRAAGYTPGQ